MSQYFDDLSADSSHEDDHGSFDIDENDTEDDADREWLLGIRQQNPSAQVATTAKKYSSLSTGMWDRCILHLDIDCFYCQCEEIDRNLRNEPTMRPLAIGQKHIIVTCNYEARKYGVQKLQSREAAYQACPHLWIVEGSDLLHYRRHSRAVYDALRRALKQMAEQFSEPGDFLIPAQKGCMDEMIADLTPIVDRILGRGQSDVDLWGILGDPSRSKHSRFVFGEDAPSSTAVLVEDQTGQQSIVSFDPTSKTMDPREKSLTASRRNVHIICEQTEVDRTACAHRLKTAAVLTDRICQYIQKETGFHATGGISVSPLLAKLTSGLHKPKSVNILYPWRSTHLLYSMPLRKMHNVGCGMMKALESEILTRVEPSSDRASKSSGDEGKLKTVLDLLELPYSAIQQAIQGMTAYHVERTSEEQCDLLIERCRGLDTSEVLDDDGGLPKTVSVENSFRRGTVCSLDAVNQGLDDLYKRLPLLLKDRASWAANPRMAYPTTIRLTIRYVDSQLALVKKRRPYVTKSKQAQFDGRRWLLEESNLQLQGVHIRRSVKPLLQVLLPTMIDITRINIAMTNFQDIPSSPVPQRGSKDGNSQTSLIESLEQRNQAASQSQKLSSQVVPNKRSIPTPISKRARIDSTNQTSLIIPTRLKENDDFSMPAAKVRRNRKNMKSTRIDHFFSKKK